MKFVVHPQILRNKWLELCFIVLDTVEKNVATNPAVNNVLFHRFVCLAEFADFRAKIFRRKSRDGGSTTHQLMALAHSGTTEYEIVTMFARLLQDKNTILYGGFTKKQNNTKKKR